MIIIFFYFSYEENRWFLTSVATCRVLLSKFLAWPYGNVRKTHQLQYYYSACDIPILFLIAHICTLSSTLHVRTYSTYIWFFLKLIISNCNKYVRTYMKIVNLDEFTVTIWLLGGTVLELSKVSKTGSEKIVSDLRTYDTYVGI